MQPKLRVLLLACIVPSMFACAVIDDIRDVVETVDEAITLLQQLDESGTWDYVSDGVDGLIDQENGYLATVRFDHTQTGFADDSFTVELEVDGDNDAWATVFRNGDPTRYFIDAPPENVGESHVYRRNPQGSYDCVTSAGGDDTLERLLRNGIDSIFNDYSDVAVGVQLLSVANEVDETTIAGRAVTHYEIESKIDDALDILRRFDNEELEAKIEEAGDFEVGGDLYIDNETSALLMFTSTYHSTRTTERVTLRFEVTQWGGVANIEPPEVANACPVR
ncbi:MAG: hypothetical protein GYB65_14265 [Chloroflexi bacterium]|nr:hypothetical protein [Chloroflexota bacterium]